MSHGSSPSLYAEQGMLLEDMNLIIMVALPLWQGMPFQGTQVRQLVLAEDERLYRENEIFFLQCHNLDMRAWLEAHTLWCSIMIEREEAVVEENVHRGRGTFAGW